jgi:sulfide:quinone oxidoreductase
MRPLTLGAGFGGIGLSTRLSDELGDDVEIHLIDQSSAFVFGFSKLDGMFGKAVPNSAFHPYSSIDKPGLRFTQTTIRSMDPARRSVLTDAGQFDADIMVVALGADLDPSATPGLLGAGHELYTVPGAFATSRRSHT